MELIVRHRGAESRLRIERTEEGYRVEIGDRLVEVDSVLVAPGVRSLLVAGRQHEVAVRALGGGRYRVSGRGELEELEVIDPLTYLAEESRAQSGHRGRHRVEAYMPGRVVAVLVEEGQSIRAGDGLVVLEAMKMENEIRAEGAGTVRRILVQPGQAVEGGDPLFEID